MGGPGSGGQLGGRGALAAIRIRAGLSQRRAAGLLGVHWSTLLRWERGRARPVAGLAEIERRLRQAIRALGAGAPRASVRAGWLLHGRPPTYPGGCIRISILLPVDFARGPEGGRAAVRQEVLQILREARPELPWTVGGH